MNTQNSKMNVNNVIKEKSSVFESLFVMHRFKINFNNYDTLLVALSDLWFLNFPIFCGFSFPRL